MRHAVYPARAQNASTATHKPEQNLEKYVV